MQPFSMEGFDKSLDAGRMAGIYLSTRSINIKISKEIIATEFEEKNRIRDGHYLVPYLDDSEDYEEKFEVTDSGTNGEEYISRLQMAKEKISEFNVKKISVASFGPILSMNPYDFRPKRYSYIGELQPQSILSNINLEDQLRGLVTPHRRMINFFVNTDANCAAVGEFFTREKSDAFPFSKKRPNLILEDQRKERYGKGSTLLAYVIVGAGIGVGFAWGGYLVRDRIHPEMGHIQAHLHPDDKIESCCKYHKNRPCIEGMACSEAHQRRIRKMGPDAAERLRAFYIAQLVSSIALILAPSAIVIDAPSRTEKEREEFLNQVKEAYNASMQYVDERNPGKLPLYPGYPETGGDDYISAPLGRRTHVEVGLQGAIYIATRAYRNWIFLQY